MQIAFLILQNILDKQHLNLLNNTLRKLCIY